MLGWPLAVRRVRPNCWYGLRVPATFADPSVWYDANAVAGRDMVALGTLVVVIALVLQHVLNLRNEAVAGICAGLLGVGSLILVVRGWRLANRLLRERHSGGGAV